MARIPSFIVLCFAAALGGCATSMTSSVADLTAARDPSDGLPVATQLPDSHVPAAIPSGYVAFCLRNSDQCDLPKNGLTVTQLNAQTYELLTRINRTTNAAIQPEDDAQHYGPSDYWTIVTDGYGDCEDYALTKRKALLDAGLPAAALRLALVITASRERHAILTIATDRGDFVMDNLSDDVKPWTEVNYKWLERQDPKTPWRWDMLSADNSASSPSAAMHRN
jgi:predicted transglutaminase-like cysteine proteinase